MEGFISGRKSCSGASLVVLVLCLGSCYVLTVVASSELPFLQPLHHGAIPESTHKLGTQSRHWLRVFFRDHMPWSPRNMDHPHHRFVHEYEPRLYMTANLVATCEMSRRIRLEHGILPEHRFHLRGTSLTPKSVPVNAKPAPGGVPPPPSNPHASVIVEVVGMRTPVNGMVDRPSPRGYPPPPRSPRANVIVDVVSPPIAVDRSSTR